MSTQTYKGFTIARRSSSCSAYWIGGEICRDVTLRQAKIAIDEFRAMMGLPAPVANESTPTPKQRLGHGSMKSV